MWSPAAYFLGVAQSAALVVLLRTLFNVIATAVDHLRGRPRWREKSSRSAATVAASIVSARGSTGRAPRSSRTRWFKRCPASIASGMPAPTTTLTRT